MIVVDFKDNATAGLKRLDVEMLERGKQAMVAITSRIRNQARGRLIYRHGPGEGHGGRFTGQLARLIVSIVSLSATEIRGEVKAGVGYARYVEGWNEAGQHVPTRRHWLSFFEPGTNQPRWGIINWALRHGVVKYRTAKARRYSRRFAAGLRYALTRTGMMVGGRQATTPFLEPTFLEMLPSAREILRGSVGLG